MATVTVLRVFWDLKARRKRVPGDVFDVSEDRAADLESRLPQHVAVTHGKSDTEDYSSLTKAELQALCDERGIAYARNAGKAKLLSLLGGE